MTQTVIQPLLFSVPAASPARTVAEYLELARKDPRAATVCSPGNGSGPHLAMELLAWASGAPLVHVPYKGDAPAVNDLVGGQVGVGAIAVDGSAAGFERFLRADLDKWSRVVKERGIKPD